MTSYASWGMRRHEGNIVCALITATALANGCGRMVVEEDADAGSGGLAGSESTVGGESGGRPAANGGESAGGQAGAHSGGENTTGAENTGGGGPAAGAPCDEEGSKFPGAHDCADFEWPHLTCSEGRWAEACTEAFVSEWSTLEDVTTYYEGEFSERWVALPLVEGGTYDFWVDWGDGVATHITAGDDQASRHEYERHGRYRITISGQFEGWMFGSLASCEASTWSRATEILFRTTCTT